MSRVLEVLPVPLAKVGSISLAKGRNPVRTVRKAALRARLNPLPARAARPDIMPTRRHHYRARNAQKVSSRQGAKATHAKTVILDSSKLTLVPPRASLAPLECTAPVLSRHPARAVLSVSINLKRGPHHAPEFARAVTFATSVPTMVRVKCAEKAFTARLGPLRGNLLVLKKVRPLGRTLRDFAMPSRALLEVPARMARLSRT